MRIYRGGSLRRRNGGAQALRHRVRTVSGFLVGASLVFLSACGGGGGNSNNPGAAPGFPAVTLSAANLDFGAQTLGTTSPAHGVTITNSGGATLTISGIKIGGGNAAAYTLHNGCGTSLPPASHCAVNVTFAPSTGGSLAASLTIADNASSSPHIVGLSGNGSSLSGVAHGMFILDPPSGDGDCGAGDPFSCYTQHLVPTLICTGNGTPVGYGCAQAGAGEPFIEGAIFYVRWDMTNPSNGTYDFSSPDNRAKTWIDSGKLVSFDFIPTSQGSSNVATPSWYMTPVNISGASQTNGIITLNTTSAMSFFPGGVSTAAGLEVQIAGTGTALDGNGTSANPGIWTVCDHHTSGCQDPSAQTIYAIGAGSDLPQVSTGTVGNPVYGTTNCGSGTLPIEWRPNFMKAWQIFLQQAVAHYAPNTSIAYLRFGLGIGGENIPNHGTNVTACQAEMTTFGFSAVPAPWAAPTNSQWAQVSATWIAYLNTMFQYEHSLNSPKMITTTLSPIETSGKDVTTPDETAAAAVAAGLGFGNQGLQKADAETFAAGQPCFGGDWCANFQKYKGQVPLELQTLSHSDPTDANVIGSLAITMPFATSLGAQILELYVDDWMCTYDTSWNGVNKFADCQSAGYPAVFSLTASQIN